MNLNKPDELTYADKIFNQNIMEKEKIIPIHYIKDLKQ